MIIDEKSWFVKDGVVQYRMELRSKAGEQQDLIAGYGDYLVEEYVKELGIPTDDPEAARQAIDKKLEDDRLPYEHRVALQEVRDKWLVDTLQRTDEGNTTDYYHATDVTLKNADAEMLEYMLNTRDGKPVSISFRVNLQNNDGNVQGEEVKTVSLSKENLRGVSVPELGILDTVEAYDRWHTPKGKEELVRELLYKLRHKGGEPIAQEEVEEQQQN